MKKSILDAYLARPFLWDTVLLVVVCIVVEFSLRRLDIQIMFERSNLLNIISNLIGTCVALAGFILAALTIIVTFKSNLKAKGIEDADNALELIFSSRHYESIVKVYRGAIMELVVVFIALYSVWLLSDEVSLEYIAVATAAGLSFASLTILRSLLILFKILKLGKYSREE